MGQIDETKNWPDLAAGLFERLTGRGAEICYDFHHMEIQVPSKVGPDAEHALWKIHGVLTIRTCATMEHDKAAADKS